MSAQETRPDPRHGIVVLGPPRSGASVLARILAEMGCDPADDCASGRPGPRALNDAILASAGSARDDWREVNPGWFSSAPVAGFLSRGRAALDAAYGGSGLFVLEDPATARLLPFWQALFDAEGIRPVHVLHHRDPTDVAALLHAEDGHPVDYGLLLWMRHVLDAEIRTRGRPRVFASHDRVRRDWAGVVDAIGEQGAIGFPRDPARIGRRVDALLAAAPDVPTGGSVSPGPVASHWSRPVFAILERWAENGEDAQDHEALDAIRAQVDAAAPLFGPLVETLHLAADEGMRLRAERETGEEARAAPLTARIESLERERDAVVRAARLERIQMQNDLQKQLVDAMVAHRGRADADLTRMQSELHTLQQATASASDVAALAIAERDTLAATLAETRALVASLEDSRTTILNSTSWKLTGPVRRLVGLVRR